MRRHSKRTVAVSLAGCDLGTSGVSVFADAILPRLGGLLASRGVGLVFLGTSRERKAASLDGAPGPVLPAVLDCAGASAAFTLLGATLLARALGAQLLYLPCANRRIAGVSVLPVVGTVHDLAQFHVASKYGHARQFYVQRVLTPLLAKLRAVTAVSEATALDIQLFAGIQRDRVRVVHNGITLGRVGRGIDARETPYLLYPARLEHPGKNHVRVVEAFAAARCRATHRLVFTGAEWGAGWRVRQAIAANRLEDRVEIAGFVSRDELAVRMAYADAVIAAGLLEGFGLPAAEALAFGRPIAASRTGSLPEVVGPLGVLFDPADERMMTAAFDRVVEDAALRARCRVEGPVRAKMFSWDRAASAIGDLLCEVLDEAA